MLRVIKGDLLRSDCNVIIHQANCFATMGAGIAKQIKSRYPKAYDADKMYSVPVGSRERLGGYSLATVGDKVIVNMYSQYHYGRGKQTDYGAMKKALTNILIDVTHRGMSDIKIGMPYGIGCGLAGGDWKIVENIIREVSREKNWNIYLYKL